MSSTPLSLRRAEVGDILALYALRFATPWRDYDWKFMWSRYLSFYSTIRDDALYEHTFARLSDNTYHNICSFVAKRDGHLVGITNCILYDNDWYPADDALFT